MTAAFQFRPEWAGPLLCVSLAVCVICAAGGVALIFVGKARALTRRDADLREAVCWIVFRRWGLSPHTHGGGRVDDIIAAIEAVLERAREGDIVLWGATGGQGSGYGKIGAAYWGDNRISELSLFNPDDGATTRTTPLTGAYEGKYSDLWVSRAEFEREWPPASLISRARGFLGLQSA